MPQTVEQIAARKKAYYEANKPKELARNAAYRGENKEKLAMNRKAYDAKRYQERKQKKEAQRDINKAMRNKLSPEELEIRKKESDRKYYEANRKRILANAKERSKRKRDGAKIAAIAGSGPFVPVAAEVTRGSAKRKKAKISHAANLSPYLPLPLSPGWGEFSDNPLFGSDLPVNTGLDDLQPPFSPIPDDLFGDSLLSGNGLSRNTWLDDPSLPSSPRWDNPFDDFSWGNDLSSNTGQDFQSSPSSSQTSVSPVDDLLLKRKKEYFQQKKTIRRELAIRAKAKTSARREMEAELETDFNPSIPEDKLSDAAGVPLSPFLPSSPRWDDLLGDNLLSGSGSSRDTWLDEPSLSLSPRLDGSMDDFLLPDPFSNRIAVAEPQRRVDGGVEVAGNTGAAEAKVPEVRVVPPLPLNQAIAGAHPTLQSADQGVDAEARKAEYDKNRRQLKKQEISAYKKQYREKNKEALAAYDEEYNRTKRVEIQQAQPRQAERPQAAHEVLPQPLPVLLPPLLLPNPYFPGFPFLPMLQRPFMLYPNLLLPIQALVPGGTPGIPPLNSPLNPSLIPSSYHSFVDSLLVENAVNALLRR